MELITVFTPAYNRAHTLSRTYESLLKQNCKNFKWLIVDDGSSDNTRELVSEWQGRENGLTFNIYIKKMVVCIQHIMWHMKILTQN